MSAVHKKDKQSKAPLVGGKPFIIGLLLFDRSKKDCTAREKRAPFYPLPFKPCGARELPFYTGKSRRAPSGALSACLSRMCKYAVQKAIQKQGETTSPRKKERASRGSEVLFKGKIHYFWKA